MTPRASRAVVTMGVVCAAIAVLTSPTNASSGVHVHNSSAAAPPTLLENPMPPLRASQASRCTRARAIADKLGETFAGHRVRETLVARSCAFALHEGSAPNALWDWPWRLVSDAHEPHQLTTSDVERLLPPFTMGDAGQWQIRCGRTELRQRCALLRIEPVALRLTANTIANNSDSESPFAPPLSAPAIVAPPVIAHAVIDTVAGRTTVLFRIFLPRFAKPPRSVSVSIGQDAITLPINRCGALGCILEADTNSGAAIVRHLWEGQPLALSVDVGHGHAEASIPALGFRDGIQGLVGLERVEARRGVAR